MPAPYGLRTAGVASDWNAVMCADVTEGARNDTVARIAGHLLHRGVNAAVTLAFLQWWNSAHCRPPLPPEEITRTVDSICRAELRRRHHA